MVKKQNFNNLNIINLFYKKNDNLRLVLTHEFLIGHISKGLYYQRFEFITFVHFHYCITIVNNDLLLAEDYVIKLIV